MRELQKCSITGEEKFHKCQECRQGGWQLSQPRPFAAAAFGELSTRLSSVQGELQPSPRKLVLGHGRFYMLSEPWGQGRAGPEPRPCLDRDWTGSGSSMVSVAGGQTVPCCSGPKLAALMAGTLLLLTGIGAASWAIGESGPQHLYPPLPPQPACPHLCLLCSDCSTQE